MINESRAELVRQAEEYFKECSKKYFSDIQQRYPNPKIKIIDTKGMVGSYNDYHNTITINPKVTTDPASFRAVVFHETIHFWDFDYDDKDYKKDGGHGQFFIERMKKINAKEGKDYVTVTYNMALIKTAHKPFFVYWTYKNDRDYIFTWVKKAKNSQFEDNFVKALERRGGYSEYYTFETDDYRFRRGGDPSTASSLMLYSPSIETTLALKNNLKNSKKIAIEQPERVTSYFYVAKVKIKKKGPLKNRFILFLEDRSKEVSYLKNLLNMIGRDEVVQIDQYIAPFKLPLTPKESYLDTGDATEKILATLSKVGVKGERIF